MSHQPIPCGKPNLWPNRCLECSQDKDPNYYAIYSRGSAGYDQLYQEAKKAQREHSAALMNECAAQREFERMANAPGGPRRPEESEKEHRERIIREAIKNRPELARQEAKQLADIKTWKEEARAAFNQRFGHAEEAGEASGPSNERYTSAEQAEHLNKRRRY